LDLWWREGEMALLLGSKKWSEIPKEDNFFHKNTTK
jgi:hypothetical protein